MKSGDFSISRDNDNHRKWFSEIKDKAFEQRIFSTHAALVAKESVNGHRMWKEYDGGSFDESKFDLVEGMWDHEHCSVCFFTIKDGFTYWRNTRGIKLLCDACHEALLKL